ncbi:helix-turn-helix transcriptional regulator [Mycolicibacterium sp. HK-90]|uniref:helix-turn-helix transcriptional regulator n=1 Tax=Mycolicibacterium sp. HK-90 TaxID=3056937 RepID=UPI002659F088|nr:helix-turn-helix transcriptional regulator [Mycolicibacterium sp. HK-90]WKG03353.1 response regulator transcription factor [Mycolicibacterium sp. HK-90]
MPVTTTDFNIAFKRNAMEFLSRFVRVSGMVFYSVDRAMNAGEHVFDRVRSEENGRYTGYFHELDPFHPRRFASSGAELATSNDLGQRLDRTDYYAEFFRPMGYRYEAELYLRHAGRIVAGVSLLKSAKDGDFTKEEIGFLQKSHGFVEHSYCMLSQLPSTPDPSAVPEHWKLSARERDIVDLLAQGASNGDIARALFISVPTVKTHLQHVYRKSNVYSRTELVARLVRR